MKKSYCSWPPKKSPKSLKKTLEKVPNRHFRDFFQTFGTFSRPFPDFWGPRGRRPRETFFRLFGDFGPGGPERLLQCSSREGSQGSAKSQRKAKGRNNERAKSSRHFLKFHTFWHFSTLFQNFSEFFLQDFLLELRGFQGGKKNQTQTFWSGYFPVGYGVFHVNGWGPKSSIRSSKPGKSNFLGGLSRDFAGISRRCPKKKEKKRVCVQFPFPIFSGSEKGFFFEKKSLCSISVPYFFGFGKRFFFLFGKGGSFFFHLQLELFCL